MDPREYMRVPFPPLERRTQGITSDTFKVPPLDGSLTIPEIFDWQAEQSPYHPVYEYAEEDGSIVSLNYIEVRRAIHRGACLVEDALSASVSPRGNKRSIVAIVSNAGRCIVDVYVLYTYPAYRHCDVQHDEFCSHESRPGSLPDIAS